MTAAHHRRGASGLAAVLVLAAAAYTVHTVRDLGAAAFFDDWLYNIIIGGGVLLALWRGLALAEERLPWLVVAAGLGFWLAGDIWWVLVTADGAAVPTPSIV